MAESLYVVIGAVVLGFISGLGAGASFGMMTDEVFERIKENAEHEFVELRTALESSAQSFFIVVISTYIGIVLGCGAYNFLISINEEEDRVITGAASVALLGISASGAAAGAICSKLMPSVVLNIILLLFFGCIFLIHLMYKVEIVIFASIFYLFVITYGIICNAAFLGFYLGFTSMFIYLLILVIFVFIWYIFYDHILNDRYHRRGWTILLVLHTLLFVAGTGKTTLYAPDQGPLIRGLVTQLLEVGMGNVLYIMYSILPGSSDGIWAGKVCVCAVAQSAVVLVAIQNSSPMVSTGARLWALIGASGSAGVALAAAGDLGQTYGEKLNQMRWGGILGRGAAILGAAAGAFFTEGTENFKYGLFKAVCAATIPGMLLAKKISDYLFPGLHGILRRVWERIWQRP